MTQAICKDIASVILSAHSPSKKRDHKWVKGTDITPPRHCKRCRVYLPEEVNLTPRESCLIIHGAWWHWLAQQAPNGVEGVKASLYEAAKSACVTLTSTSEETCLAILRKRVEFTGIPKMLEKLESLKNSITLQ